MARSKVESLGAEFVTCDPADGIYRQLNIQTVATFHSKDGVNVGETVDNIEVEISQNPEAGE